MFRQLGDPHWGFICLVHYPLPYGAVDVKSTTPTHPIDYQVNTLTFYLWWRKHLQEWLAGMSWQSLTCRQVPNELQKEMMYSDLDKPFTTRRSCIKALGSQCCSGRWLGWSEGTQIKDKKTYDNDKAARLTGWGRCWGVLGCRWGWREFNSFMYKETLQKWHWKRSQVAEWQQGHY